MGATFADVIAKLVDAAKVLFTFLKWGRIALLGALIALCMLTVMVWENRPVIYATLTAGDKFSNAEIPPLSEATKLSLKTIVNRQPNVVAVQVVQMDFRNNTRDTRHFYSDVNDLQREYDLYEENKVNSSQLFMSGDTEQNERLIKIIEQEFVCVPTPLNILAMMPSANRYSAQVCSISVPPRYGKMVGYINIWLAKPIDAPNVPYYKSLARMISDEVYDRDVLQGKR